ncbi:MAG: RIO1 family regulatory kinase/ATPase [Candidatus Bathyarchaeia archaeon]
MKEAVKVEVDRLVEEPYASILCYPKTSTVEAEKRLKELRKLGVKTLEFSGEKTIFNTHVLGKGCVGIVVLAYKNGCKTALKIRRVDADRNRMFEEAEKLATANSVDVGPKVLGVSRNFLLMQFIEGSLLPKWLERRLRKSHARLVLREILEQCWRLDEVGLDHGELSHAPKHIIINDNGECCIVDFETASLTRRPANVTSICQYLFINGETAKKIAEKISLKDKEAILDALKGYKSNRTRENFEKLLKACDL